MVAIVAFRLKKQRACVFILPSAVVETLKSRGSSFFSSSPFRLNESRALCSIQSLPPWVNNTMRPVSISISRILELPPRSGLHITRSVSNFRASRPNTSQHQASSKPPERGNDSDPPGSFRRNRLHNSTFPIGRDQSFHPTKQTAGRSSSPRVGPPREVHVAQIVKKLCSEGKLAEAIEYCTNAPAALQGPVAWNTIINHALEAKRYTFAYQQFLAVSALLLNYGWYSRTEFVMPSYR